MRLHDVYDGRSRSAGAARHPDDVPAPLRQAVVPVRDRHASPALSFYEDGRTRTVTLRAEEVEEVAVAVARYDAAAEELAAAAEAGLARFRARRQARR